MEEQQTNSYDAVCADCLGNQRLNSSQLAQEYSSDKINNYSIHQSGKSEKFLFYSIYSH